MRSNAMKTCAVGALLFGGTLGASARAATVIDDFATGFGSSWGVTTQSGAGILGTRGVMNWPGCLLSFSNPGMNWTGDAYNNSGVNYTNFGTLDFTNASLTMTGSGTTSGSAMLEVWLFDSNNRYAMMRASFGSTITMSTSNLFAGTGWGDLTSITTIKVRTATSTSGSLNYTMTSFSTSAVPAPGAAALVGLAGLAGRRRRRN
jgi:MYXO-CTERM domain-containing protein